MGSGRAVADTRRRASYATNSVVASLVKNLVGNHGLMPGAEFRWTFRGDWRTLENTNHRLDIILRLWRDLRFVLVEVKRGVELRQGLILNLCLALRL
jgi:hypothetical protein